jgi:hypothetical protein
MGVMIAEEHAFQGVLDGFAPTLDLRRGQGSQGPGVAPAVG